MPLAEVIACTTHRPAATLRRPDLGTFAPGSAGDASLLELEEREIGLEDVLGEIVKYPKRLNAKGMVIGGVWQDTGV